MRSQRGVTLTALVIYIIVFTIIIAIMEMISVNFYKNVNKIKESPKYIAEFNSFSMFFVLDAKANTSIKSIDPSKVEFGDGTTYVFRNYAIYRNGKKIAKNIKTFTFSSSDDRQSNFTKKIVNVTAEFGRGNGSIKRNIDFVLRYW